MIELFTRVSLVNLSPDPSDFVFHPSNAYPSLEGIPGILSPSEVPGVMLETVEYVESFTQKVTV